MFPPPLLQRHYDPRQQSLPGMQNWAAAGVHNIGERLVVCIGVVLRLTGAAASGQIV